MEVDLDSDLIFQNKNLLKVAELFICIFIYIWVSVFFFAPEPGAVKNLNISVLKIDKYRHQSQICIYIFINLYFD